MEPRLLSSTYHVFRHALAGNLLFAAMLLFAVTLLCSAAYGGQGAAGPAHADKSYGALGLRHVGAVYLEASRGELEVEVFKKDNAGSVRSQRMSLFLAAPDGRIVGECVLPAHDFGGVRRKDLWGPQQTCTLRAAVDEPGVYTLLVAFEEYRYGEGAVWGFSTNAARYMLDAGSGHKDGLRNERIILDNPGTAGEICFVPQRGDFKIELENLPDDLTELTLLDAADKPLPPLLVSAGKVSAVVPASAGNRNGVWRLLLPSQQVVAQIEGVTTWANAQTGQKSLALWTTSRERYFDLPVRFWLLRPRSLTRNVSENQPVRVEYTITNSGSETLAVSLSTKLAELAGQPEHRVGLPGLSVSPAQLSVPPGQSATAVLTCDPAAVPPAGATAYLLALARTDDGKAVSTYATVNLRRSAAGARTPVTPLQLKPWAHEEQQFGYEPDYPTRGEPYFAPDNSPWVIDGQAIRTRNAEGKWVAFDGVTEQMSRLHGGAWRYLDTRIAFNSKGQIFFILRGPKGFALVCIDSAGKVIGSALLPGNEQGSTFIEPPNLFAPCAEAPLIYRAIRVADAPRVPGQRWGRNHRLEILVPSFSGGKLTIAEPLVVSENCIGLTGHSGPLRPVLSDGGRIHAVWGETSSAADNHPGVPIYAASWERSGKHFGEKVLLGYAPPVNDSHNTPSMVMDSQGILHAILGSHNQSFLYAHSQQPHSTLAWSEAEAVAPGHSQTYIGLVIDKNDTLHLVFREWRREPIFPDLFDAALFYQRKEAGKAWTEPEPLILPPLPHYSVWYHKLTTDRLGRLFLSYDYWSTWMAYRAVERESMVMRRGIGRKLFFSGDGGQNWFLAHNEDFSTPTPPPPASALQSPHR